MVPEVESGGLSLVVLHRKVAHPLRLPPHTEEYTLPS